MPDDGLPRRQLTTGDTGQSYGAQSTTSVHLGSGSGESHAYVLHFEAGGEIGEHETGFGQLFVVIGGAGWVVSGSDRHKVKLGDAVLLPRGVTHTKGSKSGMTALMIQMYDLEPGQESRSGPDR
jgi:quercetin dioxygenase-like cupin family protein